MKTHKITFWLVVMTTISLVMLSAIELSQNTRAVVASSMFQNDLINVYPNSQGDIYLPIVSKPTYSPPVTPTPTPTATPTVVPPITEAIIINHNNRDVSLIPSNWIQAVKEQIVWSYGSTAHGFQLLLGAAYLSDYVNPPTFNFLRKPDIPPSQGNPIGMRLGFNVQFPWNPDSFVNMARHMLDSSPDSNAFTFAWCWQMASMTAEQVQQYLDLMTQLEGEYPQVRFVYMTGRAEEDANQETLNRNNNMVRDYVLNNEKILYDFNDMDNYLPDGTLYPGIPDYHCKWCQSWCDTHPGFCPEPEISCTHSESLDCYLKGQAFWWLSARLAGWDGIINP